MLDTPHIIRTDACQMAVIRLNIPRAKIRTAGSLPAGTVARALLHGNYEALADAWGEFLAWIASNGHQGAPDLWEVYVEGPESDPDPAAWRTELNKPLLAQPLGERS